MVCGKQSTSNPRVVSLPRTGRSLKCGPRSDRRSGRTTRDETPLVQNHGWGSSGLVERVVLGCECLGSPFFSDCREPAVF